MLCFRRSLFSTPKCSSAYLISERRPFVGPTRSTARSISCMPRKEWMQAFVSSDRSFRPCLEHHPPALLEGHLASHREDVSIGEPFHPLSEPAFHRFVEWGAESVMEVFDPAIRAEEHPIGHRDGLIMRETMMVYTIAERLQGVRPDPEEFFHTAWERVITTVLGVERAHIHAVHPFRGHSLVAGIHDPHHPLGYRRPGKE